MTPHPIFIGTAGWTLPKQHAASFPAEGSHLERYAQTFRAVEINSSFYKPHRPATYSRWSDSTPARFRFSVKLPKQITHERRLVDAEAELQRFMGEISGLGEKLGPVLVQLPPSLAFDVSVVDEFFSNFRRQFAGPLVCEPRHPAWFSPQAERLLRAHRVARVAADPPPVPAAAEPGGTRDLVYFRLHGSPQVYYSPYEPPWLDALVERLLTASQATETWCIFDNTALGHATGNSLDLVRRLISTSRV